MILNSLFFAFLGYLVLAVVTILDKFILTKSLKHPAVYAFYSTIFSFLIFLLLPFSGLPQGSAIVWSVISGVTFGLGVWSMFISFRYGEASHLAPFLGAIIAVFSLILSSIILGTSLDLYQTIGISLLIGASFLLSFEKTRNHQGLHIGFVWAVLSALLFSVSHVLAKYIYVEYSFFDGFVWSRGSIGFVALIIFLIPIFRRQIFYRRSPVELEKKTKEISRVGIVLVNKILAIISVVLIQYSISLGNVAVVNALAGMQYVLMFIFIFLLTKLYPRVFSEYFTKKELIIQTIAIFLMVFGLMFL